jgi:hypothetical protein
MAEIMGKQQPDRSGVLIDYWARVSAGVFAVVPDDLSRFPCLPAIEAALQQQIDVSRIPPAVLPSFTESQHRSPGCDDARRNAVGVVSVLTRNEDVVLLRLFRADARHDRLVQQYRHQACRNYRSDYISDRMPHNGDRK